MKVEHALQLLPNVEGFLPLRTLLLTSASTARILPDGSGSYLTVGKHDVSVDEVRARMSPALEQLTQHCVAVSEACVHALECIDRGTPAEAVDDLIRAGAMEEGGGRISQAREWYSVALRLAGGLRDRRPESVAALALARLCMRTGDLEKAARCYQRSLELAEADGNAGAEIAACEGLGDIGVVRGPRPDAAAWYARALRTAEKTGDESRVGLLRLALGKLWCAAGNLDAASEELRHARACFQNLGATENIVQTLCVQAEVERDLDRPKESAAAYREALAWTYRTDGGNTLEIQVHVGIARLCLHTARWLDAEVQIRQAERLAIAAGSMDWLVHIYTFLGTLSGLRDDDGGFVFFEQALQFSRMLQSSPMLEARVYVEYGGYRYRMKQSAEARAFLERAQSLLTLAGATGDASVVEEQLRLMDGG